VRVESTSFVHSRHLDSVLKPSSIVVISSLLIAHS
jgi:hypothetical protein